MYLLKHKSPLQSSNGVNIIINRNKSTYTDKRIDEIKKKYDSSYYEMNHKPIKERSMTEHSNKEDKENRDCFREESRKLKNQNKHKQAYIYTNRNQTRFKQMQIQKDSTLSCPNKPEVQSKITHRTKPFDLIENNFIKSTINQKLNTNQSDPFFQKLSIKQVAEQNYFKTKDSYNKLLKKQYNDPRIDNIQKINYKIKKILDCIDTCQKQEENQHESEMPCKFERSPQLYRSMLGRSIISNNVYKAQQVNQLQQTKIISTQKFYYDRQESQEPRASNRQSQLRQSHHRQITHNRGNNHFSQYLTSYKNMLDEKKQQYNHDQGLEKHKTETRYLSCNAKFKKQPSKDEENTQLMGSKVEQINQQIQKFYSKIKELQERKRKLNIKFKPFQYQTSPINKINTDSRIKQIRIRQEQQKINTKVVQQPKQQFFRQIIVSEESPIKKNVSQNSFKQLTFSDSFENKVSKSQQKMSLNQKIKKQVIIEHSPGINFVKMQKDQQQLRAFNNEDLRRKIEERFQQRKKRMQYIQYELKKQSTIKQTTKLVQALCEQAKLDEQLRSSKNWFNQCNYNDKNGILLTKLKQKGIVLSQNQINKIFYELNEEQVDPFFSFREQKCTIESLVSYFIKCNEFWRVNMLNKWNIDHMINGQNLLLHFNNKNQILIEDIVRLLNTQSGNFYRNRDVHMIFERIKENSMSGEMITIQDIQNIFQVQL